jgi:hypothetical protein
MSRSFRPHEMERLVKSAAEVLDAELLRRYRDTGDCEAFESSSRRAPIVRAPCRPACRQSRRCRLHCPPGVPSRSR